MLASPGSSQASATESCVAVVTTPVGLAGAEPSCAPTGGVPVEDRASTMPHKASAARTANRIRNRGLAVRVIVYPPGVCCAKPVAGPPSNGVAGVSLRRYTRCGTHGRAPSGASRAATVDMRDGGRAKSVGKGLARSPGALGAPSERGLCSGRAATRRRRGGLKRRREARLRAGDENRGGGGEHLCVNAAGEDGLRRGCRHGGGSRRCARCLYCRYRPVERQVNISRHWANAAPIILSACNIAVTFWSFVYDFLSPFGENGIIAPVGPNSAGEADGPQPQAAARHHPGVRVGAQHGARAGAGRRGTLDRKTRGRTPRFGVLPLRNHVCGLFCVSGPAVAGRFVPTQPCCPRRRPGGRSLGQG